MIFQNLNKKFDYSLKGKTYSPVSNTEIRLIYSIAVTKKSWDSTRYKSYKKSLKLEHYFGQRRRCAYCRAKLRADAYWNDLDHIVAQSLNEKWIFYPKNLIVTCEPCNRLKSKKSTLSNTSSRYFPLHSKGFNIFNPHFDKWSDHFEIVNGIFLKGKPNSKGPMTYEHCQLYRPDIIIEYADEMRIWQYFTMRRLTHQLKFVTKGSREEASILEAINHFINRNRK